MITAQTLRGVGGATTALLAGLALTVTGCSSSKSNPQTSSSAPSSSMSVADQQAAITTVWQRFFDASVPTALKPAMLQNGPLFIPAIKQQSSTDYAKHSTVKVSGVTIVSPQRAAVEYSILYNGSPVVSNQSGWAVNDGGTWKVSATTFCNLVSLSGKTPAPCLVTKTTALPTG
jgi:hypothetical protein